jgi:hypothetical protein
MIGKLFLAFLFITGFDLDPVEKDSIPVRTTSRYKGFNLNENLKFNVKYGFIKAGEAEIQVQPTLHKINGNVCYKVDVFGNTTGTFDMITEIRDNWGAYIDTTTVLPHMSYRKLKEGNHKKLEIIRYDHSTNMTETKNFRFAINDFLEPTYMQVPENIVDMVSGFYFLRSIDYSQYQKGDTIALNAFFEDKIYDFKILYLGKEVLKTKFGKINSFIMKPVMPDNQVFSGENAITVWFSDDENRVPLLAQADLFLGHAELELNEYKNLRSELKIIKD